MHIDLLEGARRDAVTAPMLREWLDPLGFTQITPRYCVDGSNPPVRRLFELCLLKGAGLKACWGFSLDFVPHISGGCVRWHRSDKTAKLDVIVDPAELPQPSYLFGPERFRDELAMLLPVAVAAAQRDWNRGATYSGMLEIICEIRERNTNCFGYRNYIQLPLAFAFLSAKIGDQKLAEQELDDYIADGRLKEATAMKLRRLLREMAGSV